MNKVNKKIFIGIVPIIFIGIYLCAKPAVMNIFVESNKYKTPVNKNFTDMNFYKCVIDNYNSKYDYTDWVPKLSYDDNITDEQLNVIEYLDCSVSTVKRDADGNIIRKSFRTDDDGNMIPERDIISLGLDIKDTNGIEKLHNLKILSMSNDTFSSIDLSNNSLLTSVVISNNSSISEIDLSSNINLENVTIRGNSSLTSVNLGDVALEGVTIDNNSNLTSIDLNNNILGASIIYNKKLTNISFGENSQLTWLNITGNKLKNIDLSNCPNLTNYTNDGQSETFYLNRHTVNSIVFDNTLIDLLQNENHSSNPRNLLEEKTNNLTLSTGSDFYALRSNGEKEYYTFNYNIIPQYIAVINYNTYHNEINYDDMYVYIKDLRGSSDIDDLLSYYILYKNVSVSSDGNKMFVKYNNDLVDEYDILSFKSDKYDLINTFIFGEYNDIVNNINLINLTLDFDSVNNKFLIKNGDTIMDQFDHAWVTSENYDLSAESINVRDDNIDDFLSNINCTNCIPVIANGGMRLTSGDFRSGDFLYITYGEHSRTLKTYLLTFSVSRVALNMSSINLNLGNNKTYDLYAVIIPNHSDNKNVSWSSSDENVATVDSNGLVTAVGVGEATITVTTEDGGYTDTCSVVVSESITYDVTFKDGNTVIKTVEYEENELVDLSLWEKIPDEYSIDKRFVGWLYDSNGDGIKELYNSENPLYMPASDIELTLKWEEGNYTIKTSSSEKIITGIKSNTNVTNLNFEHGSNITYKIYKGDILKDSGNIGTGNTLKIYSNGSFIESYTVVIRGDNDGDGLISVNDVSMIYSHIKGKFNFNNIQFMASDVDGDDLISVNDVSMIYSHIKRKINL